MIFGLERLAAEERETVDIGGREHLQQSLLRFGGKGLTVVERPGLRLKAVFAAVGAAGDEKRHADALAVGNVAVFDLSVVPVSYTHLDVYKRQGVYLASSANSS